MRASRSRRLGMSTAMALTVALIATVASAELKDKQDPYLPYGGVSMQGGEPPSPKVPPAGYQYINWPGFRGDAKSGAAEVFLQMSGPVRYDVKARGRRVNIVLHQTQVYLKNTYRPIFAHHFSKQPVRRFKVRPLKGGKHRLEIVLRRRAKPNVSIKTIGKYTYLVASFPGR